jgi:hypothetical protein
MYDGRMASELTRMTVNLIPKAVEALNHAAALARDNRTDTLNRALQVYDFFLEAQANGAKIYIRQPDSDELERIRWI